MIDNEAPVLTSVILTSDRVTLESISVLELKDFHEYSVCPELYEHLEFLPFQTIDDSKAYLEKLITRSQAPTSQYWFIRSNQHDKVIGTFGVHSLDAYRRSVQIGYGISPYYWGRGYFTEALGLALKHMYTDLGLRRVEAITSSLNVGSIASLEKHGFLQEGLMRDYYRDTHGKWFDAVILAKLNSSIK
jgi:ribosomal-protein-alanine N-acetyltransferase